MCVCVCVLQFENDWGRREQRPRVQSPRRPRSAAGTALFQQFSKWPRLKGPDGAKREREREKRKEGNRAGGRKKVQKRVEHGRRVRVGREREREGE